MSLYFLFLIIFFAGLLISALLTYISIIIANSLHLYAHPDERSSHSVPTPRIGGTGFAFVFFAYIIICLLLPKESFHGFYEYLHPDKGLLLILLIGGGISFVMGLLDDVKGLGPAPKFISQFIAASIPAMLGIGLFDIYLPFAGIIHLGNMIGCILGTLWILSFMNFFNFMDGMNGKAATFSIFSLGFTLMFFIMNKQSFSFLSEFSLYYYIPLILILIAGLSAFLKFNRTPAKTFMGDCGSQLLGFVFAIFALHLNKIDPENYSFIAFIILFMPFIYDPVLAVIKRLLLGENIFTPHRSHLYQRLTKLGYTHEKVLKICEATYLLCGLSAVLYVLSSSSAIKTLALLSALVVMFIYNVYVISCEKSDR